ncbi:MAG TPA: hypothetical protein DDZ89_16220 [Clostridiales bacterium]|nr:hypothetical protein [Clostridiales bacterium]
MIAIIVEVSPGKLPEERKGAGNDKDWRHPLRFDTQDVCVGRLLQEVYFQKGRVENLVSIVRFIAFVSMPRMEDYQQQQEHVTRRCAPIQ